MKRNVYKKLTLTIAATGLLLPSTVAHAAEQTENKQQVTISKQTEATENPSDGLNNQSAPKESISTQMPLSEKENSNENTKPSTDTTTKQGEQTSTQSNDTSINEEINSKQEESSKDTTEPQSNSQHEDNSKDQANSDNPTDSSNHDETNQTEHDETGSEDNHAEKPEENDGHETNTEDNHAEKTEENNSNEKEPSGGASAQNEGSTSQSVEQMPVEPTEPQTEKPSIPSNPTVPETPDANSTEDNISSNTQSEQSVYQPNQQVTPASIYHSSASDISNNSHFASVIPFQNFSFNEQHVNDEAMPFSNIGLSNARFGHLITGSFKYNPFIVHQVGMISNDVDSNESDVREILRMQSFSNNSNLNDLQENTGYFKYQYFSPINAQQYYENLDLQILGLVTADLGSMPDLKEIKRDNKAEAEQTAKTSEDTKQHEKKGKKKGTEKNTDNQKYPRLLNTLLVVFGGAFIWFIILMIMKYKKK